MDRVDLAITAGGSTCYELARCGVPSIVVSIADNQIPVAEAMDRLGVMQSVGEHGIGSELEKRKTLLAIATRKLLNDPARRTKMSDNGKKLIDGKGALRISQELVSAILPLRNVTTNDARQLLQWKNDPEVRSVSFQSSAVPMETHLRWLNQKIADPSFHLWIVENHLKEPVGLVRFETNTNDAVISVVLDQKFRGRGLGRTLIAIAVQKLFATTEVDTVLAQIKPGNIASERAFKSAGFRLIAPAIVNGQMALQFVREKNPNGLSRMPKRKSA